MSRPLALALWLASVTGWALALPAPLTLTTVERLVRRAR